MSEDLVVFVLPFGEAELLHECVTELAEAKLDAADDHHERRLAEALDRIADTIHTGLCGRGGR